jgi:hypothetical protein
MARTGQYSKLRVELLESRFLMDAGADWLAFLRTPVPETAHLAMHIPPHLTIPVDGHAQLVPANIGVQAHGNALPIHTHDETGRLHVESPILHDSQLQDFLTILGQAFNPPQVLGFHADATHTITEIVDSRPSTAFGSLILRDREDIVIPVDTRQPAPVSALDPALVGFALQNQSGEKESATWPTFDPSHSSFSHDLAATRPGDLSTLMATPRLDSFRMGISGGDASANSRDLNDSTASSTNDSDLDRISQRLQPDGQEKWAPVDRTGPASIQGQAPRTQLQSGSAATEEADKPES